VLDILTVIMFILDYVVRLGCAFSMLRYVVSLYNVFDLLSFLPLISMQGMECRCCLFVCLFVVEVVFVVVSAAVVVAIVVVIVVVAAEYLTTSRVDCACHLWPEVPRTRSFAVLSSVARFPSFEAFQILANAESRYQVSENEH
jgi:hypothetical protein